MNPNSLHPGPPALLHPGDSLEKSRMFQALLRQPRSSPGLEWNCPHTVKDAISPCTWLRRPFSSSVLSAHIRKPCVFTGKPRHPGRTRRLQPWAVRGKSHVEGADLPCVHVCGSGPSLLTWQHVSAHSKRDPGNPRRLVTRHAHTWTALELMGRQCFISHVIRQINHREEENRGRRLTHARRWVL